MDTQRTFFDDEFDADMETKRHARRTDPDTSHEAAERAIASGSICQQSQAILERLRRGDTSSAELALLALKYTARVSDLRALGYEILAHYDKTRGAWVYRLVEGP